MAPQFPPHGRGPLGTVCCKGCGATVKVIYPYTNSLRAICIEDHAIRGSQRCDYAGRTLLYNGKWSAGSGYTPEEIPFLADAAYAPELPVMVPDAAERIRPLGGS